MKINIRNLVFFLAVSVCYACDKSEGGGGTSSIQGIVIKQEFNNAGQLKNEYPSPDEEVFIIYGEENNIYDDNVNTHFDGRYSFDFLRKGTYQIFAYSECDPDTCPNVVPVFENVEITEFKQFVNADTLFIRDE